MPEYLQRLGREQALKGQTFDALQIDHDVANGEAVFSATSQAAALTAADRDARRKP